MSTWRPSESKSESSSDKDASIWRITTDPETVKAVKSQKSDESSTDYSSLWDDDKDSRSPVEVHQMRLLVYQEKNKNEKPSDYKGRWRRWPGVLLLLIIILGSVAAITWGAMNAHSRQAQMKTKYGKVAQKKRKIKDKATKDKGTQVISDDGQVGNPKKYDTIITKCAMPDYQSKDGKIWAVMENGTEIPITIKGVNWFGMETASGLPFGLWENNNNGTTAYEIAHFLYRNNFNAVRLPISVENILKNTPPDPTAINRDTNRAINIKTFMTTLQTLVQAFAFRKIGVLISMHTLRNDKPGNNWFDATLGVTQENFLEAVETVAKGLCSNKYWNVIGLDLKNEPSKATWGTGDEDDFVIGAEKIATTMLKNCPKWLGFVEGVVSSHHLTLQGLDTMYYDWWGGGLQKAKLKQPRFPVENKLVWAPHYYTTAVSPQQYFYGDKTTEDYSSYVELSDADLKSNIDATMNDMFGYLIEDKKYAMVLGEFAGLYTKDVHPLKTTKRTTDLTVELLMARGYVGGFMWSLNPESAYQYNPAGVKGTFREGLLMEDWLTPNQEFIDAFKPMDALPGLAPFPCDEYQIKKSGDSASNSDDGTTTTGDKVTSSSGDR